MAIYDLGLTAEQFGSMTPRHLMALQERHANAVRDADLRAALITCTLLNIHRDRDRHPEAFGIEDFVLHRRGEAPPVKAQSVEDQIQVVRMYTDAWYMTKYGRPYNGEQ